MDSDIPQQSKEISSTHPETRKQSHSKKQPKICYNCNLPLKGQFVKAINAHFHFECFKCEDCGKLVSEKFFPFPPKAINIDYGTDAQLQPQGSSTTQQSKKTLIYCETHYFKLLDLLCVRCGMALRGPYIKVGKLKYHMDHFS